MKLDITWAGLSEDQQRRLGIATQLVAAHRGHVTLRDWDGTRCDALIVDVADGYGRSAMASATRRNINVLGFASDASQPEPPMRVIASSSPAALIAKRLLEITLQADPAEILVADGGSESLLVRLADEALWAEGGVTLAREDASLRLIRIGGIVLGRGEQAVQSANQGIDPALWAIGQGTDRDAMARVRMPASLDSVLLATAVREQARLPPFPEGRWSLHEWPDFGAATTQINSLRVVRSLLHAPCSERSLTREAGLDPVTVRASLWALKAAGRLHAAEAPFEPAAPASPVHTPRTESGLFKRLARRFGLSA